MHREVFKTERWVFVDTYSDIFGKDGERKMEDEGKEAVAFIASRLPSHFEDLEENAVIELFRRARLFLGLQGFGRSRRNLIIAAQTKDELEKMQREKDSTLLLQICPNFPMEHFDAFKKLLSEYKAKWREIRRRVSLRDYIEGEETVETPEEIAKHEERRKQAAARHAEKMKARLKADRERQPSGLEILAFFSQNKCIRDVLYHFPIQCNRISAIDFEEEAKKTNVSIGKVKFCFERFNAYKSEFHKFTTSENGEPCGRIVYLRAEKDGDSAKDLLKSGDSVFLFHEQKKDEIISEADEEAIFSSAIEKSFAGGYSIAHCYIITEPMSSLPITITDEKCETVE